MTVLSTDNIEKCNLKEILKDHSLWLKGKGGRYADLHGASLRNTDLNGANLSRADLHGANLRNADLSCANLEVADLSGADLRNADLIGASLRSTNLNGADLCDANLIGADLHGADLIGTNLRNTDLSDADLCEANLSGAVGITSPIDYINENFEKTSEGFIVYKTFGYYQKTPERWVIEPGSIIEEEVDYGRTTSCGCGINVATREWVTRNNSGSYNVWKCLIRFEWLTGVCVPIHTDGKIRAARVQLLEEMKNV